MKNYIVLPAEDQNSAFWADRPGYSVNEPVPFVGVIPTDQEWSTALARVQALQEQIHALQAAQHEVMQRIGSSFRLVV